MKRAVSVSIGSSKRDKAVEVALLGEKICLERIGTDGDMEKAARLFQELDGKVDAFGVGGADLGILVGEKYYTIHSVQPLIRHVKHTPVVDGAGLKNTLEYQIVPFLEKRIGGYIRQKRAFVASGVDRWGMGQSFLRGGYETVFGDLMFVLGLPFPIRSERGLKIAAATLAPIATRLPFEWIYPTGKAQEKRVPKFRQYYDWASVIAGDCHYIKRHMPDHLVGKVIVTNTTTPNDVELLRQAGVKYLVTTTPVLQGRSFGTNMMEAALVAASGKKRPLTRMELTDLLDRLGFEPQLQELN
jgi:hypothetical protein